MLEKLLIHFCSPTLACLKTASLFNCRCLDLAQLREEVNRQNQVLNPKGVYMVILRFYKQRALILVYRKSHLEKTLQDPENQSVLEGYGYDSTQITECLEKLKRRCRSCGSAFPHEIGIFLGYPTEDVVAFIEKKGCGCKCCGFWKVYGDEEKAQKAFQAYEKCISVYDKVYAAGRSVSQLTVSA